jgi:hypothetical protein
MNETIDVTRQKNILTAALKLTQDFMCLINHESILGKSRDKTSQPSSLLAIVMNKQPH